MKSLVRGRFLYHERSSKIRSSTSRSFYDDLVEILVNPVQALFHFGVAFTKGEEVGVTFPGSWGV